MANPWLSVPLTEYEQHMGSTEAGQLRVLSELFAEAIELCRPASLAILGIAGGNGLERIDGKITQRIVGLDVNSLFLDAVRRRYSHLAGLELHRVDLTEQPVELQPVQMVHASLIFEHAGTGCCLESAISLTAPGGNLSVVLQLPSSSGAGNVASRFPSIQNLGSGFSLIRPEWLRGALERRQFRLVQESTRALPAGKSFWMGIFAAPIRP